MKSNNLEFHFISFEFFGIYFVLKVLFICHIQGASSVFGFAMQEVS